MNNTGTVPKTKEDMLASPSSPRSSRYESSKTSVFTSTIEKVEF